MSRQKNLIKYIFTRLALTPVMLWLISTMVFILLRIAPGDPVDAILGTRANEIAREALRTKLGLNQPLAYQYLNFLNELLIGDLGESLNNQEPVREVIAKSLPASLELVFFALIIAISIGTLIGFSGIIKSGGNIDLIGRIYGISTYAIPPFWIAILIQLFFAVILGWLPIGGRFPSSLAEPQGTGFLIIDSILGKNWSSLQGAIRHLILPACTLGFLLSGIFSRSLKMSLEKVLNKDYIEAAKSRGISNSQIILKHALPNSLLPVLTITGLTIASLIGGALLIEITFSWPGIALGLKEAIDQRDYPVVQGIVVTIGSLVILINLFIDILIALIDPRVSY
tara:strand:- start:146 stop:1165 length:1020 start_codon:yes stop_codon:yes gene_type:complete